MNAKEVIDKILEEARAEAKGINMKAQAKFAEDNAEFSTELETYKKETEKLAERQGEETVSRMMASARMDSRKKFLKAKTELLDEVFVKAAANLRSLSDADYRSFILSLLVKSSENGSEEVVIGKNENRIDQALIKEANKAVKSGKGALNLSADRADIDGGFILRNGAVRINVSIDVIVSQAREVLEIELAEKLFS